MVESGKRKFKITSKDGKRIINKSSWTKTILDVRTENADVYSEDIKVWAMSTLEDVKELKV